MKAGKKGKGRIGGEVVARDGLVAGQRVWAASGGQCRKYLAACIRVQLDWLAMARSLTQWRTREELRYAIVFWFEHAYDRRRRRRELGKLTPVEFEPTLSCALLCPA